MFITLGMAREATVDRSGRPPATAADAAARRLQPARRGTSARGFLGGAHPAGQHQAGDETR